MKRLLVGLAAAIWIAATAVPVLAAGPDLPEAFYGSLTINGQPASVGTRVEARGAGVITGVSGNPLTTTVPGAYGGAGGFDAKLIVQGNISPGASLTFFVNGTPALETTAWVSGQVTRLDLTVVGGAATAPGAASGAGSGGGSGVVGGGGGGGAAAPSASSVTLAGLASSSVLVVDASGRAASEVVLTTSDGKVTVIVVPGTRALAKDGTPLSALMAMALSTPPAPPPGHAIVLAQNFGPDGATFDPPLLVSMSYDPAALPAGAQEQSLFLAWWDGAGWTKLGGVVDMVKKTVTAPVSHFTVVGMLAELPTAEPAAVPQPAPVQVEAPAAKPAPAPAPVAAPEPALTSEPSAAPVTVAAPSAAPASAAVDAPGGIPASQAPAAPPVPSESTGPGQVSWWTIALILTTAAVLGAFLLRKRPVRR